MYNETFCKKLQEVLEDETVVERLANAKDSDELKAVFADLGLELADEDLAAVSSQLEEYRNSGELTEDMLEDVSGGCFLCAAAMVAGCVITAYVVYKIGKWIVDRKYGK